MVWWGTGAVCHQRPEQGTARQVQAYRKSEAESRGGPHMLLRSWSKTSGDPSTGARQGTHVGHKQARRSVSGQ